MPKYCSTNKWTQHANTTNAFFASPLAGDSHSEMSTQGCSQMKKSLTIGLVSEAGEGPIKTLYSEIQTMLGSKSDQQQKQAKHFMKMVESVRFSKTLSLFAQRNDEALMSWTLGNFRCHSYDMTHLEAVADRFDKDFIHYEGEWTNHRYHMDLSTLEARFDRVIQIIAGWGSTAIFDWMAARECNIEKRFGFGSEKYDSYLVQASNMLGKPPRKEAPPTPLNLWEDPRTYFESEIPMSPEKPAALGCDPVLQTKNGEKLAKSNDKKSDDDNDKKADETNDIKSDGENAKTTGTKIGKKKSKTSKAKGKKKAKKNGKEKVEQIDGKIIETLIECAQEITDQKDRKKDQMPDAPTETTIDGDEGKKDEQKYDALGQCTRVITKLDELVLHMQLATERAHAINTRNATRDWPAVALHGVVIETWTKLPEDIQQDLLDMIYIKDEVTALEPVICRERDRIREMFMIWCNAGTRALAFGCAQQYDMPILRSYEYHRTTILASYHMAMDTDIRIHKFLISTKGKRYRSPEQEATLARVDTEQVWKGTIQDFRHLCKSVDEMIYEVITAGRQWGGVDKVPMEQWVRWTEPSMEVQDAEKRKAGSGFGEFVFTS